MTEDYGALWGEFSEVMHGEMRGKYEPKQVVAVGLITAINGYDDQGHPKSATVTIGTSTTEVIERPPDQTASGDVVVVAGRQGIIGRTWTILHYLQNAAVVTASSPSRTLPTIVPRAVLTRIDQPSYGGYRSWAQIRYDVSRRNEPDLASQGIPYMATRFRVSGAQDWTELAPARHRPAPIQRTTLASDCSAVDTTISLTANDFFPVSFDDSDDDEQIRVMIDGEIVRGWYHADGTLTGCTRGVEAVGEIGVAAAHLASAASVMLLVADVFIGNLAAGIDYEAQVAPVDVNGTIGTWVPLALLNFTAADLAANPANVDSDYYTVEITGTNYELRWNRVLLDENGDPMRDGAMYQVRRSNAGTPSTDPASSDWTGATKLNDPTTGEEELLPNTYLLWDAGNGVGKWFGIRTVRRSTPNLLYGDTIVWESDNDPPPRPTLSKVHVVPLQDGYQVTVDDDDSCFADRGFMELRLYEADDASGTNSTEIAAGRVHQFTITGKTPGTTRYVQVVAVDIVGNANAMDNAYWQAVTPGYPPPPYPINGQFEVIDPNTGSKYLPDIGTFYRIGAAGWFQGAAADDSYYERVGSVGVWGSAALHLHYDHAFGDPDYLVSALYPVQTLASSRTLTFYIRASQSITALGINLIEYRYYADGTYSSMSPVSVVPNVTSTWQKVTADVTLGDTNGGFSYLILLIDTTGSTFANGSIDTEIYMDGFLITETP